jgi:hypothetical protein
MACAVRSTSFLARAQPSEERQRCLQTIPRRCRLPLMGVHQRTIMHQASPDRAFLYNPPAVRDHATLAGFPVVLSAAVGLFRWG